MIDRLELNTMAIELRNKFGEDDKSPVDVFAIVNQIEKLTFVHYPMGEHISGICIKEQDFCLIAINSEMSYGRQRLSLAHELYHLYFDENKGFAVSAKKFDIDDEIEKKADQFASFFLAPYGALRMKTAQIQEKKPKLSMADVIRLEQYFGMSHQAMLWRLINEQYITIQEAESMKYSVISKAKSCGYDDKLYLPTEESTRQRTYGDYILQAEKLKEQDKISMGKYEELLLDAFRYDIVYGDDEQEGEIID